MNQILVTKNFNYDYLDKLKYGILDEKNTKYFSNKKNYLIILFFSSIICLIIIFYLIFSFLSRIYNNKKTIEISNKYSLVSNYSSLQDSNFNAIKLSDSIYIIGLIEIPKINISYPILSNCNENLLKISVCKFSGPMPNEMGNMCIAGHNYKNSLMFSKLNKLDIGDLIYITDLNNIKKEYMIYQKSEIDANNLDGIKSTNSTEITLITCNSSNNYKRIIIKAKMKG